MARITRSASAPGSRALRPRAVLLTFLAALGWPDTASGQFDRWRDATWVDDVNFAAANALVAGFTTGVVSHLRGGDFSDGFTKGALGGAVAYGGKRIAVARFDGAGFLGREVAAVGASIARNTARGLPLLDELVLPVGPARVRWRPAAGDVALAVNLNGLLWTGYAIWEHRLRMDVARSLSTGALVFVSEAFELEDGAGVTVADLIVLGPSQGRARDDIWAHERVHVLQHDLLYVLWGEPVEAWLGERIGGLVPRVQRHVDIGVGHYPLYALMCSWCERSRDPIEVEADFLETRGRP